MRFIAPAGVPATAKHLCAAFLAMPSRSSTAESSLAELNQTLGVEHTFGLSSGRAALCVILRALHRISPDRSVVALPAYTCFSVAASVVRAGLTLYPLEINPETLDFDHDELERLPARNLLCVITANLFGILNNITPITDMAHGKGAFVVDDAAQAAGAVLNGHRIGTMADVGFYSLGRGKPMPAGEGGIVFTASKKIANALEQEVKSVPACSRRHDLEVLFKVVCSSIFLTPRLYWIPNSMKFLKLGVTEFDPSFRIAKLGRVSRALLPGAIQSLPSLNQARAEKARQFAEALDGNPHFSIPKTEAGYQATYVRFPVVATDEAKRNRAVHELRRAGIGATAFYPSAICDIPTITRFTAVKNFHRPNAEALSRRLFTLPTHSFVQQQDINRIVQILNRSSKADGPAFNRVTASDHAVSA